MSDHCERTATRVCSRARRVVHIAQGVGLTFVMCVPNVGAQTATRSIAPEFRADAIVARSTAFQLAGGAAFQIGDYLWLGGDLGAGVVTGHELEPSARVDVTGRLHLDQDGDAKWAPYLVGGMSYRADGGSRGALFLLIALGVHAPATGSVVPAMEIGLGGGVRVGIVLRRVSRM